MQISEDSWMWDSGTWDVGTRSNVNKQTTPDSYAESNAINTVRVWEKCIKTYSPHFFCLLLVFPNHIFLMLLSIFRTF